jgi:hypothetical protein
MNNPGQGIIEYRVATESALAACRAMQDVESFARFGFVQAAEVVEDEAVGAGNSILLACLSRLIGLNTTLLKCDEHVHEMSGLVAHLVVLE